MKGKSYPGEGKKKHGRTDQVSGKIVAQMRGKSKRREEKERWLGERREIIRGERERGRESWLGEETEKMKRELPNLRRRRKGKES